MTAIRNLGILAAVLASANLALAQKHGPGGPAAGAGKAENAQYSGFFVIGGGAAAGVVGNAGLQGRITRLGGAGGVDDQPPTIFPPDDMVVPTQADRCIGIVNIPAIRVTDNRDRSPDVTVTLRGLAQPLDVDPAGVQLELPLGSYDVVIVAVDGSENEARASFRIDVVDQTPPVIDPVPNPTPVGQEAEAASPAGTPVAYQTGCTDVCDDDPTLRREPIQARYGLGDTAIQLSCTDAAGNVAREGFTIRVRDTTPPQVAGNMPDDIAIECDSPQGATIDVPRIVWSDNGSNAGDLTLSMILNPGAVGEQRYNQIPAELTLVRGRHVLRYISVDEAGNEAMADLTVDVTDNGVPQIARVSIPENGWHSGDGPVSIVLDVADGCSGAGADLEMNILPPPSSVDINGPRVTITYENDGLYNISFTATDDDGNQASDNSIGFGIDRDAPRPAFTVPSQAGVNPNDDATKPIFALAELLPTNEGGVDEGDGVTSGVRNVTVEIDPGAGGRIIANQDFNGNGNPPRGAVNVGNVGCEIVGNDGLCTEDGELNLRLLGSGAHVLRVSVTDFAGNTATRDGNFLALNLADGLPIIQDDLLAMIQAGPPAEVRGPLALAVQASSVAQRVAADLIANDYGTPVFLGGVLRYVQTMTIQLSQAIAAAQGGLEGDIIDATHLLLRLAQSDVQLLQQHAVDEGIPAVGYLREAFEVDGGFVDDAVAVTRQSLDAEQWNQAAANTLLGVVHAKSMLALWIEPWAEQPDPFDIPSLVSRYAHSMDILTEIRDELTAYLRLDGAPANRNMTNIRDRLADVIARLEGMITDGDGDGRVDFFLGDPLDPDAGLSDQAYVEALLDLRAVANFSAIAGNEGAWVRNYQWSIMQIVRFFVQSSIESANAVRGGNRENWPIYVRARELIAGGVDELDERQVQAVIDRYGQEEDSICLIIASYHCDFLDDEGQRRDFNPDFDPDAATDQDRVIPEEEVPAFCWAKMYRPSEWEDVVADARFPQQHPACHYAKNGDLRQQ